VARCRDVLEWQEETNMSRDELTDLIASAKGMLSPELLLISEQISTRGKYKGRKNRDVQEAQAKAQASTTRTEVCQSDTA